MLRKSKQSKSHKKWTTLRFTRSRLYHDWAGWRLISLKDVLSYKSPTELHHFLSEGFPPQTSTTERHGRVATQELTLQKQWSPDVEDFPQSPLTVCEFPIHIYPVLSKALLGQYRLCCFHIDHYWYYSLLAELVGGNSNLAIYILIETSFSRWKFSLHKTSTILPSPSLAR